MSIIGNIIWAVFGGFVTALGYVIGGVVLCLTIVGIPFGLQAFRLAWASLAPFGKSVTPNDDGLGCLAQIFNLIWIIFFGWEIALVHLVFGVLFTVTIVGIPFGKQHFKLVAVALFPFSYRMSSGGSSGNSVTVDLED
jgi:uncharacterized membrane protein YccF (DUF307 family)